MGVMATGVHDPLMPGDIFHLIGLLDGQGVHIGPEGNGLSRLSSPDLSHKAAVAFIFSKWDPHFCQLLYYICLGLRQVSPDLRDLVQVPAHGYDLIL